ncbi:MAG: ArnT family glycosyltransferase [Chloroflexota bacterium]
MNATPTSAAAPATAVTDPSVARERRQTLALFAVPLALLIVAGLLRLPDLATRGTWDADQGHDMLVLRSFVRDGVVPLLGPPTSIGDVHHGALYYFVLAPAAWLTGGDSPLAVVTLIALAGIAAVLVTWWLARSIAGPVAGLVAGLAMAVSASAIDESTFIWNPNLIALSSAIALAAAWRAWSTGRPRWWLVAAVGTALTMQFHVLGVTMLPIVGGLLVADARRQATVADRRRIWRFGLAGLAIIVLAFTPLVVHELTTDFSELHAALDYIRAGGDPAALPPATRLLVIAARTLSWPLTGLLTDRPAMSLVAVFVVVAIVAWRAFAATGRERVAVVWLGVGLAWTAIALTFIAPSLATVVPGLPNDHYHAFADPMVFTILGMGAAAVWRLRAPVGPIVTAVAVGALLASNVAAWPPTVASDGGFPAAERAASRILASAGSNDLTLRSLPDFKSTEAYAYPLVRAGAVIHGAPDATSTRSSLVVICDSLFEDAIGAACGGPAESIVAPADRYREPLDRFEAAPGRTVSVYRAVAP